MAKKIIIGLIAIIIVIIVGLQLFLQFGLTSSLKKYVLPNVKEQFGLDIAVDHLRVNLLAGALSIHGVEIANPPGFKEPDLLSINRCRLDIGLLSLLKGGITEIQEALVRDANLVIVRKKEGNINIQQIIQAIQETMPPPAAGAPAEEKTPVVEQEGKALPCFLVEDGKLKFSVQYVDLALSKEPFTLTFEVSMDIKNVSNYGDEDVLSGVVKLNGTVFVAEKKSAFKIDAQVAPIVDPTRMTFIATGSMPTVDLALFSAFANSYNLEEGSVSGKLNLACNKGIFDDEKSALNLKFENVKFSQAHEAKTGGISSIESFTVVVPVTGTMADPRINIGGALKKSLFSQEMLSTVAKDVSQKRGSEVLESLKSATKNGVGTSKTKKKGSNIDVKGIFKGILTKPKTD